jgi:hypothetical protein
MSAVDYDCTLSCTKVAGMEEYSINSNIMA